MADEWTLSDGNRRWMSTRRAGERIARRQHGVLSRRQATAAGLSPRAVDRSVAAGRWERIHPGVYRIAGTPRSWHQELMAACLWGGDGTAVSHRAAAALWGLDGFQPGIVEISGHRRLRSTTAIVHRVRLARGEITRVVGIPVTHPARTLLDVAGEVDEESLEIALDDALRRRLTSLRRLQPRGGRERRGSRTLGRLVQERVDGAAVAESALEVRLFRLVREAGLPEPRHQYEIREEGQLLARVDLAYPDVRLAIEADGYRYHSGRLAWQRDLARRNALAARGWRVVHVTWGDLRTPERILMEIGRALGTRPT